ncbi:sulfite exporter TauE/SafE family protein [Herbaspirillum sp. RV1423]|uniref:sulfite exporter TauE/SafE family protein n=1 Tax=Herbaspirillum sp. RV1423 TaxID=1443993 RepID=UPI0004BAD8E0|nr:sulfite exporter TauE/SafE family protein [Herbaspirillum sp. RV1423]
MLLNAGLGFAIGVILALTGAGGGILAVPVLMFGAGLSASQAGPIGLMAVGMAAALGALLGLRAGIVRYKASLLIAASGMVMAPPGLWLAHHSDNRWLTLLFAAVLLYVALRMLRQSRRSAAPEASPLQKNPPCIRNTETGKIIWTTPCARALGLSGAIAGFLSGLLGVGGGFVMVPALQRYTDLAMQSVVATSLAVIALVSATGVASSALAGQLDWTVALPFSGGALIGMLGGRMLSARLSGPRLQQGFGAVAGLVAIGMVVKAVL